MCVDRGLIRKKKTQSVWGKSIQVIGDLLAYIFLNASLCFVMKDYLYISKNKYKSIKIMELRVLFIFNIE